MLVFNTNEDVDYLLLGYTEEEAQHIGGQFEGKEGDVLLVPSMEEGVPSKVFVGLGKEMPLIQRQVRNSYAKGVAAIPQKKPVRIHIVRETIETFGIETYKNAVQGVLLASYKQKTYKAETEQWQPTFYVDIKNKEEEEILIAVENLVTSVNEARELIVEPPNKLYPETLAQHVIHYGQTYGYNVKVFEEPEIKEMGMEAFLSVGQGTDRKPRLIVMEYLPVDGQKPIGLVGKGLTCDTGGYCVKGAGSMPGIKADMAGAANVIAVMNAMAKNQCQKNVVAVVATCENVIDGNSYIPGSVISSMAKKSIEIINTDAEGRLTLADALTYIQRNYCLEAVVDLATLTGATGICFGNLYTPLFGNTEAVTTAFLDSAKSVGEDYWTLPLDKRYRDEILTSIADLKNSGKPATIAAALFLQEFIEDTPWLHLDIASTATQYPAVDAYSKDVASGIGIFTLYHWINKEEV